jgi:Asp-tRNA(Asn)/Glu-tRNA(Gln) amidotransferase A subunit family amidase
MKPTFNAISAEGVKLVSFNIDTCGFFARSLEDLQLVADVFNLGWNSPPAAMSLSEAHVAFVKTPVWPMAGPSTIAAMQKAASILQDHGVKVEEVELPDEFCDARALKWIHKTVLSVEAQSAFLMEYRMDRDKLDANIRGLVENESNLTLQDMVEAVDKYASMRSSFDRFAANFSAIITPSAVDVAPLGLDDMGDSSFNSL